MGNDVSKGKKKHLQENQPDPTLGGSVNMSDTFRDVETQKTSGAPKREKKREKGLMDAPDEGWLHKPELLAMGKGIFYAYPVEYVGSVQLMTSLIPMNAEDKATVCREAIARCAEASGIREKTPDRILTPAVVKCFQEGKTLIQLMAVKFNISSEGVAITDIETNKIISRDVIAKISFAAGGDGKDYNMMAYVAKDKKDHRYCHVFNCHELVDDVIATVGQSFVVQKEKDVDPSLLKKANLARKKSIAIIGGKKHGKPTTEADYAMGDNNEEEAHYAMGDNNEEEAHYAMGDNNEEEAHYAMTENNEEGVKQGDVHYDHASGEDAVEVQKQLPEYKVPTKKNKTGAGVNPFASKEKQPAKGKIKKTGLVAPPTGVAAAAPMYDQGSDPAVDYSMGAAGEGYDMGLTLGEGDYQPLDVDEGEALVGFLNKTAMSKQISSSSTGQEEISMFRQATLKRHGNKAATPGWGYLQMDESEEHMSLGDMIYGTTKKPGGY